MASSSMSNPRSLSRRIRSSTRHRSPVSNRSDSVSDEPQAAVAVDDALRHLDGVGDLLEVAAGLEVHQLAGDVDPGDLQVVLPLARAQRRAQLAGLGVDEVGGERAGVAAEQGVGQGHVTPPEAGEVQPDEEHGQGVDEALGGVRPQRLAVERAVGQRVLQVPGQQAGVERLPVRRLPPAHHPERLDARQVHPLEVAQHGVLAAGEVDLDLLDRQHPVRDADEPHGMPRDAARERGQPVGGPVLQRDGPGQVEQRRVGAGPRSARGARRHAPIIEARCGRRREGRHRPVPPPSS